MKSWQARQQFLRAGQCSIDTLNSVPAKNNIRGGNLDGQRRFRLLRGDGLRQGDIAVGLQYFHIAVIHYKGQTREW